jgi:hypothetical protein
MSTQPVSAGIGLRPPHYAQVLDERPDVGFVEVISENFLGRGGNPRRVLHAAAERYPISLHGVSLNLGSIDPIDDDYLGALAALIGEVDPVLVSDHLCWTGVHGRRGHDLWPLPLNRASLEHVCARLHQVQDRLKRAIALENVSTYVALGATDMPEWELLGELCRRTGCGLLLDVNNVYVSARNLGFDPDAYIASVPVDSVREVHLAGHREFCTHLLDTHDRPVCDAVWRLYADLIARTGPVPTLIEWDAALPPLRELVQEARRADDVGARVLARSRQELRRVG